MKFETTNPPVDLCCAVQGLTDAQSSAIRDMGFESIKSLSIHKIPTGLGQQLLVNYDHKRNELNVGSHIIAITPSKVHDVLGVPMGKIPVCENRSVRIGDVNRKKWRKQFVQEHITVKHVVDKLKLCKKGGKLFKLNFLVVFNSIMGETTKSGTVNQKFLASIKVRNIGNMDWCSYIITCLRSTKEGWNGKEPYNGPLTFLAVLYAHEKQLTRCPENTITPAIQYVTTDSLVDLESSMPEVDPFSQFIEVPVQFETRIVSDGGQSGEVQPQTDDGQTDVDQNKNVPLHQEDEVQPQTDEVQPQTYESQTANDQNVCILQDEEVESLFQSTNSELKVTSWPTKCSINVWIVGYSRPL